jgi:arylsulfatase A-like enzyme
MEARGMTLVATACTVGLAAAVELAVRCIGPAPYAPTLADVALGVAFYVVAALPALAASRAGWHRGGTWLSGLPLALLAANVAFGFGTHSRVLFAGLVATGLVLGAIVVARVPPRALAGGAAACLLVAGARLVQSMRTADSAEASVLLVVLDTTAASHLSAYGYARPTSPNLATLAGGSLLYRRAIATAPWTLPSHASIFSGRYPSALGFDGEDVHTGAAVGSIARDLAASGRATAAISANPIVPAVHALRDGFAGVWAADRPLTPVMLRLLDRHRWLGDFQSRGERVTALALDWIDRLSPRGRPWFLFVNYIDPHAPYRPPPREREAFAPGVSPDAVAADVQLYNAGLLPLTPEVTAAMRGLYDGEVAAMDEALGRLIAALAARGYADSNLLVVVTADHGESLGEHGFVGHILGMPDAVLHVPLLLRGLGVPRGVIEDPVQPLQLRATVRAVLGLPALDDIAPALPPWGVAPRLLVTENPEPRWYLDELRGWNGALDPGAWRGNWTALEHAGLKVVFDDAGHGAAYDLRTDPDEQMPKPLSEGVALVSAYAELRHEWRAPSPGGPSEKTRRALQAIGYLR